MTRLRLSGSAALLLLLCSAAVVPPAHGEPDAVVSLPLRIEAVGDSSIAVPVTGGIPFPRGALASADQVRIVRGKEEVPAQVLRKAVWPDGSVKWVLVDLVVAPAKAKRLTLEYGPGISRGAFSDPLVVRKRGGGVDVSGPGLSARVGKDGSLAKLTVSGRSVIAGRGARLVLEALRVSGPEAFPGPSRVCHDASARAATGKIEIDSVEVESAGPIRARVLLRGSFRVPRWGADLPRRAVEGEPAGRVPFSLRFDFHRGLPLVTVAHQLVYTGEPDRDFVTRWGFEVPGQGAGVVRLVEEPGLTTDARGDEVARSEDRLCAADLKNGFALIRAGWENRPCLLGGEKGDAARIDLWPREAGVFDLRRYAREWGIGETGDRDRLEDIERYARYAARGMAKSHVFLMHFGGEAARDVKEALAEPALLVAPPGRWAGRGRRRRTRWRPRHSSSRPRMRPRPPHPVQPKPGVDSRGRGC